MRSFKAILFVVIFGSFCHIGMAQEDLLASLDADYILESNFTKATSNNGFDFTISTTQINSKYSDYPVGFFKEKFISYSARKIGAIVKKNPITNEPYTKLYCSDITYEWDLRRPLLFSSILNKKENLGTIAFSSDGTQIFFTKSQKDNPDIFQIYTAVMNPDREGEWIDIKATPFNDANYSFENPHLSRDGKRLYYASNTPEAIGGFDIFYVDVKEDGTYGNPERVEGSVNTVLDEKYPQTSLDGKYLYFSSKGHDNTGGYDIYRSKQTALGFVAVRNLGNTINSPSDDIAYVPATQTVGYFSSNRAGGLGSYDIYKLEERLLDQNIVGIIKDKETSIPLANTPVVLVDDQGIEVASILTDENGTYSFPIDPFVEYTVLAYKEGFKKNSQTIATNTNLQEVFTVNLSLEALPAPIVETKEISFIQINNILFDLDSAVISDISTITLNKVVATLAENPEIKIAIKAHTDAQGSASYNLGLSKKRAQSTLEYLVSKGVDIERLTSEGYGETQLLIECTPCTNSQHQTNRRVEFIIETE